MNNRSCVISFYQTLLNLPKINALLRNSCDGTQFALVNKMNYIKYHAQHSAYALEIETCKAMML